MFQYKEINFPLILIISTIILVVFVIALFLFIKMYQQGKYLDMNEKEQMRVDYEKQLLQSQIEVQESTLSSVSKELHDNIGQLLSTAKMLLGITERNLSNPPDTLITANATVGEAIDELRSLSKSLSKEWLEQFNLLENLGNEVNRHNSADGVRLHLAADDKLLLKADEQIILFRIIQEAIQNAIKHASAKNIFINIQLHDAVLVTSIRDDGKGFEQNAKADGVGLLNMQHRTKLLGGTIEWISEHGGCTVLILLPVKKEEQ